MEFMSHAWLSASLIVQKITGSELSAVNDL